MMYGVDYKKLFERQLGGFDHIVTSELKFIKHFREHEARIRDDAIRNDCPHLKFIE